MTLRFAHLRSWTKKATKNVGRGLFVQTHILTVLALQTHFLTQEKARTHVLAPSLVRRCGLPAKTVRTRSQTHTPPGWLNPLPCSVAGQLSKGATQQNTSRETRLITIDHHYDQGLPVSRWPRWPGKILYLAMDRPAQIARSLHRQFAVDHRGVLGDRLVVWKGPPRLSHETTTKSAQGTTFRPPGSCSGGQDK
jgi:hypothetical protein